MEKFFQKHKSELKTPAVYLTVGTTVLVVGAVTGNLESFATIMLGVGAIVFGIRDIAAMYLKDLEE